MISVDVDDILMLINRADIDKVMEIFNSYNAHLKFTVEIEKD